MDSMQPDALQSAIAAARLLGRWTLVARKHDEGCSCCPGLGNVRIDAVEGKVAEWLGQRHESFRGAAGFSALLRECIERRRALEPAFLADLEEAIDHLERVQSGIA